MKKLKEWINKPITWKDSIIATIIGMILSFIYMAFMFGWFKILGNKIGEMFDDIKSKIKK